MRKLLLAATVSLSALTAHAAPYCDPLIDPSARVAARQKAAANPLGQPHLKYALTRLARYGLDGDSTLEVVRANRDAWGTTHTHLRQLTFGVPVKGGGVIVHQLPTGAFDDDTVHVVGGFKRLAPGLTDADAIARVTADARRTQPFVVAPTATLFYAPRWVWALRSGAPAPGPTYDPEAENPLPEPITGDDVERRLVGVDLVYEIETVEGDCTARDYRHRVWEVDAVRGTVLSMRSKDDNATGTGANVGAVSFNTDFDDGCFVMKDNTREFRTEDDDHSSSHPVNCDSSNTWGDGQNFMGDATATSSNRQSAMVDVHFGATVYWDLLSNVFGFQGPDDDFYSVNAFVHDGTDWDNAAYHPLSGNVSFGDGAPPYTDFFTQLDITGHELGHAWNDHNTGFDGDTDCLNESLADIFGEWSEAYLNSGNFAAHATSVGNTSNANFVHGSRNLIKPKVKHWYNGVQDLEVHRGSGPSSRAFTFLARGASPFMKDPSYSHRIPWGMRGLGLHSAARIYFNAVQNYVVPGAGYLGLRPAMYLSAKQIFGSGSTEVQEVFNAYAGISIGTTAASYPAKPGNTPEVESNDTQNGAQPLTFPPVPAGVIGTAPQKLHVTGTQGSSQDWFRFTVFSQRTLRVNASNRSMLDVMKLQVRDANGALQEVTVAPGTAQTLAKKCTPTFPFISCAMWVTVVPMTQLGGDYTLDLDLEP